MVVSKTALPSAQETLPGRADAMPVPDLHYVNNNRMKGPFPEGLETAMFGLGCFWGAERLFWKLPGVYSTQAGYAAGTTPNPTYKEVCSGLTGHAEVVRVIYDPKKISYEQLLKTFWENHDPTQGMRQGNDVGTQYRSAIYWTTAGQERAARTTYDAFGTVLREAGVPRPITTELLPAGGDRRRDEGVAGPFYFAEDYHQQYLEKNPGGYCLHGPNGLTCPVGVTSADGVPAQMDLDPPA